MSLTSTKTYDPAAIATDTVISLSGVSKVYNLYRNKHDRMKEALHPGRKKYHKAFYALNNINLDVQKGEIVGIIGRNGCGKSTLLKIISKVLMPTCGTVHTKGNIVALLELGAGFNPEFTGMENIYFYCALLGYRRYETEKRIDEILEFAGLDDFIHQPIKTYSSGMKARLAFAVSVNVDPDILILDEVLAVGDELFRRKCYAKMDQFFKSGKTILFVSHSPAAINLLCTRAVFLDRGEVLLEGPTKLVTRNYNKFLYAKKNGAELKAEIIALNRDESLKQAIYQRMSKETDEPARDDALLEDFEVMSNTKLSNKQYNHEEIEKTFKKEPYFVPDFKPLTTEVQKNADIDICDIQITTLDQKKVNFLVKGEKYYYAFVIKSNIDEEDINIVFSIVNEKSIGISGFGGKNKKIFIPKIFKGDEYIVKIKFKCNINQGIYYINTSLTSYRNSEAKLLLRISDALAFKVLPEEDRIIDGLVSLEQEIFIEKKK